MTYPCDIKQQAAQPAVSVRTRTPVSGLKDVLGKYFGMIVQYLGEQGALENNAAFVAYYNMDMQDLDIEVGFTSPKKLPARGEMQPGEVPGGKYASLLYTGPYEKMEPAYGELTQFVKDKGYETTGVVYEFYLNGPETPPEQLQTLIWFPLKD